MKIINNYDNVSLNIKSSKIKHYTRFTLEKSANKQLKVSSFQVKKS